MGDDIREIVRMCKRKWNRRGNKWGFYDFSLVAYKNRFLAQVTLFDNINIDGIDQIDLSQWETSPEKAIKKAKEYFTSNEPAQ